MPTTKPAEATRFDKALGEDVHRPATREVVPLSVQGSRLLPDVLLWPRVQKVILPSW